MFDIKKKILELDGKQARNTSELTGEQIRELILENERLKSVIIVNQNLIDNLMIDSQPKITKPKLTTKTKQGSAMNIWDQVTQEEKELIVQLLEDAMEDTLDDDECSKIRELRNLLLDGSREG